MNFLILSVLADRIMPEAQELNGKDVKVIDMQTITKQHARQFILAKQGLTGAYRFIGKDGTYEYVRQAGCIQYDPVDVCGKNAELTLQSRVKGFRKEIFWHSSMHWSGHYVGLGSSVIAKV